MSISSTAFAVAVLMVGVLLPGVSCVRFPSVVLSDKETSQICAGYSELITSSGGSAGACSKECGRLYYNAGAYDYTRFITCYRCCYSGGMCISPVDGISACSERGTCLSALGTTPKCACDEEYTGAYCERKVNECPVWGPQRIQCGGNGQCKNALCQCNTGWRGIACQDKVCPISKANGKECSGLPCNALTGKCLCGLEWKGETCDVKACPRNDKDEECNGSAGTCVDGKCQCGVNFKGPECQTRACPRAGIPGAWGEECGGSAKGTCGVTGECHCRAGLKGAACSDIQCPILDDKECGGRGKCTNGQCVCEQGVWKGKSCEIKACPFSGLLECGGRGFCTSRGECQCDADFKGPNCGVLVCPKDANGNECSLKQGTCGADGKCQCAAGWRGIACEIRTCPIDHLGIPEECGGPTKGVCNDGKCTCNSSWKGDGCQMKRCPGPAGNECNGRSSECNDGKCICKAGFNGASCENKNCPTDKLGNVCSGLNGVCNGADGTCKCNTGFRGTTCEKVICPFSSKNNLECYGKGGTCSDDGVCTCPAGWEGKACDMKMCPIAPATGKQCNGAGSCNPATGTCTCDPQYRGADCGTYYVAKLATSFFAKSSTDIEPTWIKGQEWKVPADSAVTIHAQKGELFESTMVCNLMPANIAGGRTYQATITLGPNGYAGARYGSATMQQVVTAGAVTALATPNIINNANVGYFQPGTSVGLFRADATGEFTITPKYNNNDADPNTVTGMYSCALVIVRVNSGVGAAASPSAEANSKKFESRKLGPSVSKLADDAVATLEVSAGQTIRHTQVCSLWTIGGATVYMRSVAQGNAPNTAPLPGNWITATGRAAGIWSTGLSQAVYSTSGPGTLSLTGSYHVGSNTGSYGECTSAATLVNNTWSGATSDPTYHLTGTTHTVEQGTMDYSTTINDILPGDAVRAVVTCNMYGSANAAHWFQIQKNSGVPTTVVHQANHVVMDGTNEWHPGTSVMIVRASSAGSITFGAIYASNPGYKATFVYCNIYAENLGYLAA